MTSLTSELSTGDGRTLTVGDLTQIYRDGVSLSTPSNGKIQRLGENEFSLTNKFNTIDCDTLESIKNLKVYSLTTKTIEGIGRCIESVRCVSDAHEVAEVMSVTSDNGRFMARIKVPSGGAGGGGGIESGSEKRQLLEIWDRDRHLKTLDINDIKVHGLINTDSSFGSFVWSKHGAQDKLLYVCHAKKPKCISFFKDSASLNDEAVGEKKAKEQEAESGSTGVKRGEEYVRREDWGECLTGIEHTMVGILDVGNNMKITTIDIEGHSVANPQWLDNGTKIVSVAYAENPRRLGLIYCNNRPSKLMVHEWQTQKMLFEFVSEKDCYHSPRASNEGTKFIYLMNPVYGPHRHAVSLNICDIRTGTNTCLLAEQFIENLPERPFTSDDNSILFTKGDHLFQHMCLYNIERAKLIPIKFPTTGMSIYDFRHDIVLASGSEVNATPTLFVAVINPKETGDVVAWHQIQDCIHLDEVEYETFTIPIEGQSDTLSAILVKPVLSVLRDKFPGRGAIQGSIDENNLPTVVVVHGGPHSNFELYYMHLLIFYARLGLKTILINYRGSTGVNEEYVQSLSGKVGHVDVEDCLTVIRYFVKKGKIDPTKLVIQGGSHGGFLSCHLSCQDEFKFTSAVIRNPVVDISSMHTTSDIPDWSYSVTFGHKNFDHSWMPTGQDLIKMYECSPMSKFNKAYVPTLMLLGSKDQRVKMYQGERWIELLRAQGIETLCKVYPDNHSLSKPAVAADGNMTAAIWILEHLPN